MIPSSLPNTQTSLCTLDITPSDCCPIPTSSRPYSTASSQSPDDGKESVKFSVLNGTENKGQKGEGNRAAMGGGRRNKNVSGKKKLFVFTARYRHCQALPRTQIWSFPRGVTRDTSGEHLEPFSGWIQESLFLLRTMKNRKEMKTDLESIYLGSYFSLFGLIENNALFVLDLFRCHASN